MLAVRLIIYDNFSVMMRNMSYAQEVLGRPPRRDRIWMARLFSRTRQTCKPRISQLRFLSAGQTFGVKWCAGRDARSGRGSRRPLATGPV